MERGLNDFIASAKRQGVISGSHLLRLTAEQAAEWQTSEGERLHKKQRNSFDESDQRFGRALCVRLHVLLNYFILYFTELYFT